MTAAAPRTLRISKSRYVAGLQCHKLLWLKVHEPDAAELTPGGAVRARWDAGHRVGARAQACFPGGTLIDFNPRDRAPAVAATRAAIDAGASVIFEACFVTDQAFAAIDVLERRGDGWTLIEVKATSSVKPQHLPDLAIQVHLARSAGLRIDRVEVMHLNRAHRHPDIKPLFLRTDVTAEVNALVSSVEGEVVEQLRMVEGGCPDVAIGDHCDAPYECPFKSRCWPVRPKHDVGELYGMSRKADSLRAQGYETIDALPDTARLSVIAARQRRAIINDGLIVEPGLRDAMRVLVEPLAFLDFETIAPALPTWRGQSPYQATAVQHSVHRVNVAGEVEHHAFLAEPGTDPRDALARHLLASTKGAATVLAWNASFEQKCIKHLAKMLPDLADELHALAKRMCDLLPIVRKHIYHSEFRGSFSLKAVGPTLVSDLAYTDLEVADGSTASAQLETYLLYPETLPDPERSRLRAALLEYCERDTLLLVRLVEVMRRLAVR